MELFSIKIRRTFQLVSTVSLKWQIKLYRWADIPRLLAPKEYYMFIDGEAIVKSIKRDIDRMSR